MFNILRKLKLKALELSYMTAPATLLAGSTFLAGAILYALSPDLKRFVVALLCGVLIVWFSAWGFVQGPRQLPSERRFFIAFILLISSVPLGVYFFIQEGALLEALVATSFSIAWGIIIARRAFQDSHAEEKKGEE